MKFLKIITLDLERRVWCQLPFSQTSYRTDIHTLTPTRESVDILHSIII